MDRSFKRFLFFFEISIIITFFYLIKLCLSFKIKIAI